MKIQREEHKNKGAFFVEGEDGDWVAEMTYYREGQRKIVIDHTEVEESLQNQGIGEKMVKEAVKFAEENNLLIKPVCPFVKEILESSDEYEDVLTR